MSKESIERDLKFREWKRDIEKRCEEHLRKNPDIKPAKPPNQKLLSNSNEELRMDLSESGSIPGAWNVYKNGKNIMTFFGVNAYQDALKYVKEILNY